VEVAQQDDYVLGIASSAAVTKEDHCHLCEGCRILLNLYGKGKECKAGTEFVCLRITRLLLPAGNDVHTHRHTLYKHYC
jgi:hypothetical protein